MKKIRIIRQLCRITNSFARNFGEEGVEKKIQECKDKAWKLAKDLDYKNPISEENYYPYYVCAFIEAPTISPAANHWKEVLPQQCNFEIVIREQIL